VRYFLEFAYNGSAYHGWQKQPNATTVQEVLEHALSMLLRQTIEVVAAGRTDAGVHAKQMFAHFDVDEPLNKDALLHKLNSFLPKDIAVYDLYEMTQEAHARFDATARTYEYWITLQKNPFLFDAAYHVNKSLDVEVMNKAAAVLFEFDDFQCFSKSNTDVKTYICKIIYARWEQQDKKLVFTITADRFLRNMVRAIVGTLLDVGLRKKTVEDVKNIIKSKNRSNAGVSVPGHALYLTKVIYPKNIFKTHE
jgi:tRNA pseudouridine38-40 synthase